VPFHGHPHGVQKVTKTATFTVLNAQRAPRVFDVLQGLSVCFEGQPVCDLRLRPSTPITPPTRPSLPQFARGPRSSATSSPPNGDRVCLEFACRGEPSTRWTTFLSWDARLRPGGHLPPSTFTATDDGKMAPACRLTASHGPSKSSSSNQNRAPEIQAISNPDRAPRRSPRHPSQRPPTSMANPIGPTGGKTAAPAFPGAGLHHVHRSRATARGSFHVCAGRR